MDKQTIRGATHDVGAPVGWDPVQMGGRCGGLPIRVIGDPTKPGSYCESAWKPTKAELEHLNDGGLVILRVAGWQVPVALYVEYIERSVLPKAEPIIHAPAAPLDAPIAAPIPDRYTVDEEGGMEGVGGIELGKLYGAVLVILCGAGAGPGRMLKEETAGCWTMLEMCCRFRRPSLAHRWSLLCQKDRTRSMRKATLSCTTKNSLLVLHSFPFAIVHSVAEMNTQLGRIARSACQQKDAVRK